MAAAIVFVPLLLSKPPEAIVRLSAAPPIVTAPATFKELTVIVPNPDSAVVRRTLSVAAAPVIVVGAPVRAV